VRATTALCAAVLLAACGDERSAGGGGIETNNTLSARVVDSAGAPVGGARVEIRPDGWTDTVATGAPGAVVLTGADGRATALLPSGRWCMVVRGRGTAALRSLELRGDSLLAPVELAPMATLSGIVAPIGGRARSLVQVPGTAYRVWTDSVGNYRIDSLPAGFLPLAIRAGSGTLKTDSVRVASGDSARLRWTGDPELRPLDADGSILVDDFSGGRPSIAAADRGASWYAATDAQFGGGSRVLRRDSTAVSDWASYLVPDQPTAGESSFQAVFDLDSTADSSGARWAQIGLALAGSGSCIDLTSLDSISFLARGEGATRIELLGAVHDTLDDYGSCPGTDFALDSNWIRRVVPASSLVPAVGAAHPEAGWARTSPCVHEIRFVVSTNIRLDLARLRLHGPRLESFLRP